MAAMSEVEVVIDEGAAIGEAPTWSHEEAALYWIDVKAPALYRYDPQTGEKRSWPVDADFGGFALYPGSQAALVALRTGLCKLDLTTGALTRLVLPPFDPAMHRFNEGACDPSGRFWIGVMFDPLDPTSPALPASLHSFTIANGLRYEPDEAELHNGMAWSADGRTMFLTHSNKRSIYRFEVTPDGSLSRRSRFAVVPESLGLPDGAAVDTDGGYWCALHGGGRLRRFRADGSIDRDILLPVSQPTMCAFGGEALDTLYVTSAAEKLSAEQRQQEPLAGALLRLRPGERGIPRRCTLAA